LDAAVDDDGPLSREFAIMSNIETFLAARTYAVAGASADRDKYGNKVFLALTKSGRETYPLNPRVDQIEGHAAFASIVDLPSVPESMSIITPAKITREIVAEAIAAGVKNIWMQPGAEDDQASESARNAGMNVIDDGSCILVLLAINA
jgi:predicted CoA-binding protein